MNPNESLQTLFVNRKCRSSLLEKEEEYKRINEQLEKKSSDLFDRIEKFSKSHRLRLGDGRSKSHGVISRKSKSLFNGGGDSVSLSDDEHENFSSQSVYDFESMTLSDSDDTEEGHGDHRGRRLSSNLSTVSEKRPPSRLQQATESVIKNLQGKLGNQEERMTDLTLQYRQKIQENTMLESRVKLLEDEREKLFKTVGSLQGTVEKHAHSANTSKSNLNLRETTVGLLKKEISELKREQRTHSSSAQSFQTRLHRALEENQRLKNQNRSLTQQLRDLGGESRQKLDGLSQRIHELERQKSLLNATLFKQTQLVEKLKRRTGRGGANGGQGHDVDDSLSCFSS